MSLFGAHTPYVLAAYGAAVLILGGMIVAALVARVRAARRLAALEREGKQL